MTILLVSIRKSPVGSTSTTAYRLGAGPRHAIFVDAFLASGGTIAVQYHKIPIAFMVHSVIKTCEQN